MGGNKDKWLTYYFSFSRFKYFMDIKMNHWEIDKVKKNLMDLKSYPRLFLFQIIFMNI